MSMTTQEKVGVMNFILTVFGMIALRYLMPVEKSSVVDTQLLNFTLYTLAVLLVIHIVTWLLLLKYFNLKNIQKNKNKLMVYEAIYLFFIVILYPGLLFAFFPGFLIENLLTGYGLYFLLQMFLSVFLSYVVVNLPLKYRYKKRKASEDTY